MTQSCTIRGHGQKGIGQYWANRLKISTRTISPLVQTHLMCHQLSKNPSKITVEETSWLSVRHKVISQNHLFGKKIIAPHLLTSISHQQRIFNMKVALSCAVASLALSTGAMAKKMNAKEAAAFNGVRGLAEEKEHEPDTESVSQRSLHILPFEGVWLAMGSRENKRAQPSLVPLLHVFVKNHPPHDQVFEFYLLIYAFPNHPRHALAVSSNMHPNHSM